MITFSVWYLPVIATVLLGFLAMKELDNPGAYGAAGGIGCFVYTGLTITVWAVLRVP